MQWLVDYAAGTPHRTFVLYPLGVVVGKWLLTRGHPRFAWPYLALFAWGYGQYRLCGAYRQRHGAGSRGMRDVPTRLISTGPYAVTRNPMYMGHLIALLGLTLFARSRVVFAFALANAFWFNARVERDEQRLHPLFGAEYDAYCGRVPRWL